MDVVVWHAADVVRAVTGHMIGLWVGCGRLVGALCEAGAHADWLAAALAAFLVVALGCSERDDAGPHSGGSTVFQDGFGIFMYVHMPCTEPLPMPCVA